MDGLEAVAQIGQRAPDIHRHRVVQVGLPHVVFDIQPRGFVAMRFVAVGLSHLFELPVARKFSATLRLSAAHC